MTGRACRLTAKHQDRRQPGAPQPICEMRPTTRRWASSTRAYGRIGSPSVVGDEGAQDFHAVMRRPRQRIEAIKRNLSDTESAGSSNNTRRRASTPILGVPAP